MPAQAFLHDPAVKPAEENREFIIDGMLQSLKTLSLLADGEDPAAIESHAMGMPAEGDLVASFANFEVSQSRFLPAYTLHKISTFTAPPIVTSFPYPRPRWTL